MMGRAPTFDGATLTLDGPRATGSTGCNTYMARHDPTPGAAQPLAWFQLTRMACSDLQMAMERHFLETLEAARSLEPVGEDLILRDAAGAEIARLTRAPGPQGQPTS
jgi:heat shock protein HslJ